MAGRLKRASTLWRNGERWYLLIRGSWNSSVNTRWNYSMPVPCLNTPTIPSLDFFISYFYSFIYLLFQLTAEWSRRSLFLYSLVFVMSWWLGGSNKAKQTAREQQRKRTEDRRRILRAAEACNPANLAAALDGCQGADINYHSSLAYDGCPFGTCNLRNAIIINKRNSGFAAIHRVCMNKSQYNLVRLLFL